MLLYCQFKFYFKERHFMELKIVAADCQDYAMLTKKLDDYYFELVGDIELRYADVNRPENMSCRAVVYEDGKAVACGAWKDVDEKTAEIKRIYVLPEYRRRGAASMIIKAMEENAASTGRHTAILETARTTDDSASLYRSLGYVEIDYYGSPAGAENCRCFRKEI